MVAIQRNLSKKHTIALNYSYIGNEDKSIKRMVRMNKTKKTKHIFYDMYNHSASDIDSSENETFECLKKDSFSYSRYESKIIPKVQNNTKKISRRNKNKFEKLELTDNIHVKKCSNESEEIETRLNGYKNDSKINHEFHEYQYGTLVGDRKIKCCLKNYLNNWSTFIEDIENNENVDYSNNKGGEESQIIIKRKLMDYPSYAQTQEVEDNTGYLTPTSQKDDSCSFEENEVIDQNKAKQNLYNNFCIEEENLNEYSPIIFDNFDDISPFENDFYEDERIRKILNAKVLPNDYIGKIPPIPEKPMGELGKLMEKYHF